MDAKEQQALYAKARKVMEPIIPLLDEESDQKVVLNALMLLTARSFHRLGLEYTDEQILAVLINNVPAMIQMWEQAENDLSNVVPFPRDGGHD